MSPARLAPWLPLTAIGAIGIVFPVERMTLGALVGLAAFAGLVIARRALSLPFGAWTLAAAVALGFSAAVLANLAGLSASQMLAAAGTQHLVGSVLGVLAVACAVMGLLIVGVAFFSSGRPGED